ncbi:MAG: response regulator, partial [Usitatibacter sp.]
RDFLLRQHEFGIAETRSRYVPLFALRMDDLDQALRDILQGDVWLATRAAADEIGTISLAYRAAFLRMAQLTEKRGSINSGFLGDLRRKGDKIETMLGIPGDATLLADTLRLRRAKADYVLSNGRQYPIVFREAARDIVRHVDAARLPDARKQALLGHLATYTATFEEFAALSGVIDAEIVRFREAAGAIRPIFERVAEEAGVRRDLARHDLLAVTASTTRTTVAMQLVGLLVGGLMVGALYRKITAWIDRVGDFSGRIAAGDFSARFATRAGGEGIRLASALNGMADDLQRSRQAIAEREAQLDKARRAKAGLLSSVSHELKTPLNAMVGFAELLKSSGAGPLSAPQRECAEQISASGLQLSGLIDRILEATRAQSGEALGGTIANDLPGVLREAARGIEIPRADPAVAGARVLVVDDHPVNRMVLGRQLGMLGYDCELAGDGVEALAKFNAAPFGLVVTDCNMPVMDGYELARRIRDLESSMGVRRTPIVACTAKDPAGEAQRCREAGMDDCIAKPFKMQLLRDKMDQWLPRECLAGDVDARPYAHG